MGVAVTAAWDQFEAATVRPDAVVLIGSGARAAAVVAAADGFGAPVIPCRIASAASAVGAALTVTADVARGAEPVERVRSGRGTAVLVAAAGVLVGGLIAGGVYATNGSHTAAVVADTRIAADAHGVDASGGSSSGSNAGLSAQPGVYEPRGRVSDGRQPTGAGRARESTVVVVDTADSSGPQTSGQRWGSGGHQRDRPLSLMQAEPASETEPAAAQVLPGTGIPGATTKVGAPNGALMFPGEAPPPAAFTTASYRWWDNHFRMLMQWAAQQLLRT
jgi:hypothetical protein